MTVNNVPPYTRQRTLKGYPINAVTNTANKPSQRSNTTSTKHGKHIIVAWWAVALKYKVAMMVVFVAA